MKKFFVIVFIVFSANLIGGQNNVDFKEVDALYREDQFYVGATYNLFGNKPNDLKQSGFSLGFHLGLIRDMPINKNRDLALGVGLGYSTNSFNNNLLVEKNKVDFNYSIIDESVLSFSKNKLTQHLIELPIEFRWRSSNASEYSFWRVYIGFKLGYVVRNSTKFVGDTGDAKYVNIKDFNDFQYGLSLSLGYNTWNIYMYYALNPVFSKNAKINNQNIDINAIKVGLMFYIL